MAEIQTNNLIVVSDLHCGDQMGLCPDKGCQLDQGGWYTPNTIQRKVWDYWNEFWCEWVPMVTRKEPYCVVVNGDALEGQHHGSTHQISPNKAIQLKLAYDILSPIAQSKKCQALYMIRGTEAHVGPSAEQEESLAKSLGSVPDPDTGTYSRFELWKRVGTGLVHILHHIGTTGSAAYEATAVNKELTEEFNEAARWREEPPAVIVRSHRHRCIETRIPTARGYGIAIVTPAWQAKTPFSYRIPGGRLAPPQFGGVLVRTGDEELYVRSKVWAIQRSPAE